MSVNPFNQGLALAPARQPVTGSAYNLPGMSGPRTILSVFPLTQRLELRHEGIKIYEMPAATKGSYQLLTISDTYAWNRNWNADQFELIMAPIPATVVAENLVQRWTRGLVGTRDGLGPGVLICKDLEPTAEEIIEANARQDEYFRHLINEAEAMDVQGQPVTDLHRIAAGWMGVMDRRWAKPLARREMKQCPACAEEIRAEAKICRFCHSDIEAFSAPKKPTKP